jgi:hypothetical protein
LRLHRRAIQGPERRTLDPGHGSGWLRVLRRLAPEHVAAALARARLRRSCAWVARDRVPIEAAPKASRPPTISSDPRQRSDVPCGEPSCRRQKRGSTWRNPQIGQACLRRASRQARLDDCGRFDPRRASHSTRCCGPATREPRPWFPPLLAPTSRRLVRRTSNQAPMIRAWTTTMST